MGSFQQGRIQDIFTRVAKMTHKYSLRWPWNHGIIYTYGGPPTQKMLHLFYAISCILKKSTSELQIQYFVVV